MNRVGAADWVFTDNPKLQAVNQASTTPLMNVMSMLLTIHIIVD